MALRRAPYLLTALLTLTAAAPSQVQDAPLRLHKDGLTKQPNRAEQQKPPKSSTTLPASRQRTPSSSGSTAQQRMQHKAEQNLRESFHGGAISCAGGGKAVLYLRSPTPSRSGCNVRFEARCPGTREGTGTRFGRDNYVGASCSLADSVRIGPMRCAPAQVQIRMTHARCG
jgi:hypothetical protein